MSQYLARTLSKARKCFERVRRNYFMRCWHSAPRTGRRALASVPMRDTGLQPDRGGAEGHGGAWGMNEYVPRRMTMP